jgi:hypothetical protein
VVKYRKNDEEGVCKQKEPGLEDLARSQPYFEK